MRVITETEFHERLMELFEVNQMQLECCGYVTGPGRSGAIASVYASHMLGIPFVPYGNIGPIHLGRVLLIDTARETGKTMRKAEKEYERANPFVLVAFEEPPRVSFWYEAGKPQKYRHEVRRRG